MTRSKFITTAVLSSAFAMGLTACNSADTAPSTAAASQTTAGKNLLSGALTDNFHADGEAYFTLAGGELTTKPDGGRFKLRTLTSYKDFELSAEFYVGEESNSGIYIRCTNPEDVNPGTCYEVNISQKGRDGSNNNGSVFRVADALAEVETADKWNTMTIKAQGDHILVHINGVKTADLNNDKLAEGILAIQYVEGGHPFKMRNFVVNPL